jgi:hypothetical protein
MATVSDAGRRPPGRTAILAVMAVTVATSAALGVVELALRVSGRLGPVPRAVITVHPDGRYQEPDPQLGFRPLPGRLDFVFGNGDRWTLTNLDDRTRVTRPIAAGGPRSSGGVWLFGCSFVQGWGLNDDETAAWKLQQALPSYDVVNFGVGGYGTLQSLLQFRRALGERPLPAAVLLGYADFHDERNTRTQAWREANVPYEGFGTTAQPFARLAGDGTLTFGFDDGAVPFLWWRQRSRVVNGVARAWGRLTDPGLRSAEVSQRLLADFAAESHRRGVPFVMLGVARRSATRTMLAHFAAAGVTTADISVDPAVPGNTIRFDGHPSARANSHFASAMVEALRGVGVGEGVAASTTAR